MKSHVKNQQPQVSTHCLSHLTELFYCLYFALRPFYLRPQGTIQMADVCLIMAGVLYLGECMVSNKFKDFKSLYYFYVFIASVMGVNLVYAVKLLDTSFLIPTVYWIFNMIFLVLSYPMLYDRGLLKKIIFIFKMSICIQSAIYIFSMGKWYGEIRYCGITDNPNQFAFFMLVYAIGILLYEMYTKKFTIYGCLCMMQAVFLIIKSASRGMFLCVFLIIVFEVSIGLWKFLQKNKKTITGRRLFFLAGILILMIGFAVVEKQREVSFIWNRWVDTFSSIKEGRGLTSNGIDAFAERGIDRVWKYPEYWLLGAGEGGYGRFRGVYTGEVHSTFLGILFCYGFFPFLMVGIWCFNKVKNLEDKYLAVYMALIIGSFTIVNYRQPIFWLLFVIAEFIQMKSIDRQI